MLRYWSPYFDGSNYYSVDNIRLDLDFLSLSHAEEVLSSISRMDGYKYYRSFQDFQYKNLFVFGIKGHSFSLGVGFNGCTKAQEVKGFLDFNPNKIIGGVDFGNGFFRSSQTPFQDDDSVGIEYLVYEMFQKVLELLRLHCLHIIVKRWDLAVDVPVKRSDVVLYKDRRKYSQFYHSSEDFTEYLGCSDTVGRVKVYNKRLESELDYDLTRIEVTLCGDSAYCEMSQYWPEIYKIDSIPLDSDKFVISLLRELPADRKDWYIRKVSDRRTKQKYKALLVQQRFEVPPSAYEVVKSTLLPFEQGRITIH